MQSGAVVKGFDVIEDGGASLGAGGEAVVIDQLVFEGAPEGLDEGVVVAVAWTTHGSDQAVLSQKVPISRTGKLASPIGVEDERTSGPALA